MLFGLSIWKVIILLVVVLLIFGNRLPSLARSLGSSIVEFKKGLREIEDGSHRNDDAR